MNIDLDEVVVGPLDEGAEAFHHSLGAVLDRVAPLVAPARSLAVEDRIRRLAEAINLALDALEALTGMVDPERLPALIERVADLSVTGGNVEVLIGIAGDLRVDKRRRLVVDDVLTSCRRIPPTLRPTALLEGVATLQRLLALLLLHGWTDGMSRHDEARHTARRAIVDTVQGRLYAGQPAL